MGVLQRVGGRWLKRVAGTLARVNSECCCGDVEPCREYFKCFADCGSCGSAGFSPYTLGEIVRGGEPCIGFVREDVGECQCCNLEAGELATLTVVEDTYDYTVDDTLSLFYDAIEGNGDCIQTLRAALPSWVERNRRITTTYQLEGLPIGTGLPRVRVLERTVETSEVIRTLIQSPDGCGTTSCSTCFPDVRVDSFPSTVTDGPFDVPLGQLYPVRSGCFEPLYEENGTTTEGDPFRVHREWSFASSCDSFSERRVSDFKTQLTQTVATRIENGSPVAFTEIGFTDIRYARDEIRWRLQRSGSCDGATPAFQACDQPSVYLTRDCETGEPGPSVCAARVMAYLQDGILPRSIGIGGCCYEVLIDQGPQPGHGIGVFRVYDLCVECNTQTRWLLENCETGERDRAVLRSDVEAFEDTYQIIQTLEGDCYRILLGEYADLSVPLIEPFLPFPDCETCVGDPPVIRLLRRCDNNEAGPSVVNFEVGRVVRHTNVCYVVTDEDGAVEDVIVPDDEFDTCEECEGPADLRFAIRRANCRPPQGCRTPFDEAAPPIITYDERDRPPGADTLVLAGVCSNFLVCYDITTDPATEPIVPPPPGRLAWRSDLVCQNTNQPPACCTLCPCGNCDDPVQFEDGRPFDIPIPEQFDEAFGTEGLF